MSPVYTQNFRTESNSEGKTQNERLLGLGLLSALSFYFGLLTTGVADLLSLYLIFQGFVFALIQFTLRPRFSLLLLTALAMGLFKVTSYVVVNSEIVFSLSFLGGEGRLFVAVAVILSACTIRLNAAEYKAFTDYASLGFVLWSGLLLLKKLAEVDFITASHHQLGVISLSGFLLLNQAVKGLPSRVLRAGAGVYSLAPLLLSGSRTSIIMAIAISLFLILRRLSCSQRFGVLFILLSLVAMYYGNSVSMLGRTYRIEVPTYMIEGFHFGYRNSSTIEKAYNAKELGFEDVDFNLLGRSVVFGKAAGLFEKSPIIGVGVGRFDDTYDCQKVMVAVCIIRGSVSNTGGATAHSSYLHILAEEGFLGAALLAIFLLVLVRDLPDSKEPGEIFERAGIWIIFLACFIQHVFASPLYAIAIFLPLILAAGTCRREAGRPDHVLYLSPGR